MNHLILAITGASGPIYGIRLLQLLAKMPDIETHLVLSQAARITIAQETDFIPAQVEALADVVYRPGDIGAAIASGSFAAHGMIVAPCSIKTLSAIAHSYANDLIARAADVQLKEGRPLLLMVRETPLHLGHLRLMTQAAEMGAIIFPPVPAFYARPQTLDEMVMNTVGRMLARIGIPNDAFSEWRGIGKA
ncbi:MAG TPA: UbiX family flavin prenyltransferase [Anaerolineae bacterium]|nr:UbiX family flavin prenyltransferase [Caldilineae bacterium]HID35501.1 UbiX family flavin prenyltransferase [Anaerolineae bacterium]HIQ12501.1 UbiX family flavin prenyltransferase [Caldilineales bacterium]